MISKQANSVDFGNEMFEEMDRVLQANYAHVEDITKEPEQVAQASALSDLTAALVTCAAKLDEVGHPSRVKADKLLRFIETDILK